MKNKTNKARGIWTDIAILIACLAIVTSSLASGVFARFATRSEGESGTALVASFDVDASLNASQYTVNLADGSGTGVYTLELENRADTAVSCSVRIEFNEAVGEFITAKVGEATAEADTDGKVFTVEKAAELAPHEKTQLTIELIVDPEKYSSSGTSTDYDFTVNVTFTQID